jgi:hypothetical protein
MVAQHHECTMLLNYVLKMVMTLNIMLCIFYNSNKKKTTLS